MLELAGDVPSHADGGARFGAGAEPYDLQDDLIDDVLASVYLRARTAAVQADLLSRGDPLGRVWPNELAAIEARIDARLSATETTMPLRTLRERFALTRDEEHILWVLLAHEICPTARQLLREIGTEETADLSTDTVRRAIFGRSTKLDAWTALGEEGPLRRFGLMTPTGGSEAPDHRQTWKLSRRVLALAHGEFTLDPSVEGYAAMAGFSGRTVGQLEIAGDAVQRAVRAIERGHGLTIVHGRVGSGRRSLLLAVAEQRGMRILEVRARALSHDGATLQLQLRAVARECQLLDLVPLVRDLDALVGVADQFDRIELLQAELPGLVLATAAGPIARRWRRAPTLIELGPISGQQRSNLWRRALPALSGNDTDLLATMYPLAPSFIETTCAGAIEDAGGPSVSAANVATALRAVLDDRLAGLATRIHVTQSWDDLVLPDDQAAAVLELLARIRGRTRVYEEWGFGNKIGKGLGVSALFSGPPGTGKSMAAGLVARALHTEIYQVDLSKIVSKWIGETEKNLAALFDAAEAGHAFLLFDEADALFGKRTDVKSSNDRYANQEVNFLLQRLESFSGICILTTNHDAAIDEAFRRRLSIHVRFPMPEVEERLQLWERMIPPKAPTHGNLDLERLAEKFVMSGGYIRNAVLRAAFLAADEGGAINAARLSRAAHLEYEAMGKVVTSR